MKILVIRFSSIGDIVLTTPVIRAIKTQLEDVEVHYLTKENFQSILQDNASIDKLHLLKDNLADIIPILKAESFDVIVDLHNNLRTRRIKKALKITSYTFKKLNIKKWLLTKFKLNKLPSIHVVDRYFNAVLPLGVKNNGLLGEFPIAEHEFINVKTSFNLETKKYISIAIGAQFATKQMPIDLIVEIVNSLDAPVVIVGGPMDKDRADSILNKSTNKRIINSCGQFSLAASASIVIQSSKLLTGDTGMMHIAACFDVPIVSVWGNTTPDFGMFPYKPNDMGSYSIHEVNDLSCRPCSKIGYQNCPKKHFDCMNQQNVLEIVADLKS